MVAGHALREPRFHADDEVAIARDRIARGGHVGAREVHRVAFGDDSRAADVDEDAPDLRGALRDRDGGADRVGAGGARVDPAGHSVEQRERRAVGAARRVRVDVDEAGHDELTEASIVSAASAASFASIAAMRPRRDSDVAHAVEPHGRIDYPPTLDDQVVLLVRGEQAPRGGERCRARGRRGNELAPVQHVRTSPVLVRLRSPIEDRGGTVFGRARSWPAIIWRRVLRAPSRESPRPPGTRGPCS